MGIRLGQRDCNTPRDGSPNKEFSCSAFAAAATLLHPRRTRLASLPALAADELHYNQISLRAEVSQEVAARPDDRHPLHRSAKHRPGQTRRRRHHHHEQGPGPGQSSQRHHLRQGSRNSYPIYDTKGQKITGWRERAELRLESADFAALSKLTGELLDAT